MRDQKEHFDLTVCSTTTQAATDTLTLQDLLQLMDSLQDEMRAGEQQSLYESLYNPVILRGIQLPMIGGVK